MSGEQQLVSHSVVRSALKVMALSSLVAGAAIYMFSERWGLDGDTAGLLSGAFILMALFDGLVLRMWRPGTG